MSSRSVSPAFPNGVCCGGLQRLIRYVPSRISVCRWAKEERSGNTGMQSWKVVIASVRNSGNHLMARSITIFR
ncbi:hypothetical protein M378DRAFT_456233 [Amanita muscaria Koide BX008]|uniref:Uncharacterized protein n=1 Tax=Amanita muscaria (strain Koide BX008) TaxID=946122 RepID=A0A0C2TFM6_AMAMK|nr:hypothetical protein M378DRAFT_456233 [Amanita muscaria Koide BX008]